MSRPVTSASNLFRRQKCPGSARLEYGLPDEDSEQAKEGQLLHDYSAHPEYDRTVLRPDQRDLLDRNDSLIQTVLERVQGQLTDTAPVLEREVKLSTGTADFVAAFLDDMAVLINDTKFGFKVVERADLNLQLRAYAVGVHDEWGDKTQRIFTSITQPRLGYEERITLAEYGPKDIADSREQIASIIEKSEEKDAPLIPGDAQCGYCKAKLLCPEYKKWIAIPVAKFPKVQTDLSKRAREEYLAQRLGELSDEELEKVHLACSLAGMVAPLEKDEIRKRIAAGGMDNFYLGEPRKVRELADAERAISLLSLAKVATRDEVLRLCSFPLGKDGLEDLYRKKTGCTWKEAKDKINKVLASVIETKEEKPWILKK